MAGEAHLVFQAGGRRIAVPLADLVGIAEARVTPLPLAFDAHLGLMPHQGTVYPVLDSLALLGLGRMHAEATLVVLLEVEGRSVGLACQRVEGAAPLDDRPGFASGRGHEEVVVGGWPAMRPDLRALLAAVVEGAPAPGAGEAG
jgi:hypothetical protein